MCGTGARRALRVAAHALLAGLAWHAARHPARAARLPARLRDGAGAAVAELRASDRARRPAVHECLHGQPAAARLPGQAPAARRSRHRGRLDGHPLRAPQTPHTVHCHTVHLRLGALLRPRVCAVRVCHRCSACCAGSRSTGRSSCASRTSSSQTSSPDPTHSALPRRAPPLGALLTRCTVCGTTGRLQHDDRQDGRAPGSHMAHSHTVHLPRGALLNPCTMCGYRRAQPLQHRPRDHRGRDPRVPRRAARPPLPPAQGAYTQCRTPTHPKPNPIPNPTPNPIPRANPSPIPNPNRGL